MRIFVTVGNALQPFDRMLRVVDAALAQFPDRTFEGVCQHGTSAVRPQGLRAVSSLSRDEFAQEVHTADVIVTHAGVGSVKIALDAGHVPVVFARRGALGEHVDDHQMQLAREFARLGSVVAVVGAVDLVLVLESFLHGDRARRRDAPQSVEGLDCVRAALGRGRVHSRKQVTMLALAALLAPALDAMTVRRTKKSAGVIR